MTTNKAPKPADAPQPPEQERPAQEGDDVEGHNLWVNPSASREMVAGRSKDIEREARERQRAKEARTGH